MIFTIFFLSSIFLADFSLKSMDNSRFYKVDDFDKLSKQNVRFLLAPNYKANEVAPIANLLRYIFFFIIYLYIIL